MSSNSITAIVDNDKSINLETDGLFRKIINVFFIPILNNLPKGFKEYIKKTNESAARVIENATNHDALEVLYSKGNTDIEKNKSFVKKIFQEIWFNLDNSKGVRNRLKLVIRELDNYLKNIASPNKEINIISIASGSSRAVVEVVKKSSYLDNTKLSLTFLDKNPKAIEYSKKMCSDIKNHDLNWINDSVGNFFRSNPEKKFDIVEIVGLLDYFNDSKVVETFNGIHKILKEDGIVIAANISHNKEEKFITNTIDWPMIYRTPVELGYLISESGFSLNKMKVFYEPLKVHGLVVAIK